MTYAKGTTVDVEKSRLDVDRLLARHGASQRGVMQDDAKEIAAVAFVIRGAKYRIDIPLPKRSQIRDPRKHAQACRERWRLVLLALKSKLELVALGGSTIEREFFADLVLPNGQTAHQGFSELLRNGLGDGLMRLLPPAPGGEP